MVQITHKFNSPHVCRSIKHVWHQTTHVHVCTIICITHTFMHMQHLSQMVFLTTSSTYGLLSTHIEIFLVKWLSIHRNIQDLLHLQPLVTTVQITNNLNGRHVSHACHMRGVNHTRMCSLVAHACTCTRSIYILVCFYTCACLYG